MSWQRLFANGLEVYLNPPGQVPGLGPERGRRVRTGIAKFSNPYGSHRYVKYAGGVAVGVLQVVELGGGRAVVANVYVQPSWRRIGVATELFERAGRDFTALSHSSHQSGEGTAWVRSLK